MADTLKACDRMIKAANKYRKTLHIGFTNRYHPGLRRIKEAVDSGSLGKILFGHADLGSYFTLMCSRSRYQANFFGALLMDYTHQLDYMPWIMGSPVVRLYAVGRALGDFELKSNPNMMAMILEHANDTVTEIHLDYCRHPQQASAAVTGDKGYIKTDFSTNRVLLGSRDSGTTREETVNVERDDLFREQFRQFSAAVAGRPAAIVPGPEGRRSVQLVEAARQSLESRRPVKISG
jgi:predicted dehydrogenase